MNEERVYITVLWRIIDGLEARLAAMDHEAKSAEDLLEATSVALWGPLPDGRIHEWLALPEGVESMMSRRGTIDQWVRDERDLEHRFTPLFSA